ncbi:C-Jun-amino-terminal kinase-interacting protein 4-like [Orbicella faveolata]|uniref:C-Jun-amino-terminal kinase-interacting protein 4-like n=1 Tax=Orbicella faveolata TaxID=48498 RepID=UPI0009E452F1|nr:C-Jun-amino-terminal kinase-interacting protein 4-like [Orbicella faveolata]
MKREYHTLHERHSELLHQHMERLQRDDRKGSSSTVDTPTRNPLRPRAVSSESPRSPVGTPVNSIGELVPPGTSPVAPKSPDVDVSMPQFPANRRESNEMSLEEEQLAGVRKDAESGKTTTPGEDSSVIQNNQVSPGGTCVTANNVSVVITSDKLDAKTSDIQPKGSRSSTASSLQSLDTGTCHLTDVDNMPIMTVTDVERAISGEAQSPPDGSFLSNDAAAIMASTPELNPNALSSPVDVIRRGGSRQSAERPISLDLETLPEGVSAHSLFAELSVQEPDIIGQVDTGADITAMVGELDTVLKENTELLTAKTRLVTQKNDLLKRVEELSNERELAKDEVMLLQDTKTRLSTHISELEQELKRVKMDAEKATVALKEANVSAAHRKRFTRVEMARVLMERNQYKERLMELQEAVRWTEMIRASKERNLELQQKKKSSIWKFFSNLFGPSPKKPAPPMVSIRYNSPQGEGESSPASRRSNSISSGSTGSIAVATGGGGFGSENFDRQRVVDRRERYRQVRAFLNSDVAEGRMQAYGWSLPAKYSTEVAEGGKSLVSVPVPVYCRPLNLNDPGMKIWCAAGVDLSGGKTQDGGSFIGATSVFYTDSARDQEEAVTTDPKLEPKVSMVWIGSSTHSCSKVTVVDANYPQNILDCFIVCTSHLLCLTPVPGASEGDYQGSEWTLEDPLQANPDKADSGEDSGGAGFTDPLGVQTAQGAGSDGPTVTDITAGESMSPEAVQVDGIDKMSSVLPTMWLGAQSGCVYVHSVISDWKKCIHSIRLKDSVLSIVYVQARVLVGLADGTVAIFHRASDGQWNFNNYHLLDLGRPHHSIRCMTVVHDKVWCGYRNKIQVIHPRSMKVEKTFDAHPRRESQVRQLAWIGDGVWVSIRLDSTLRLYNAHTYHHLQDIDIEPYVSKMLGTGKLGFSFVRITSLMLTNDRLWVGTGNGVILSVPLVAARPARDDGETSTSSPGTGGSGGPGGAVRVYSNEGKDGDTPRGSSFMPYCSMVNAQLSFHGHRDSVKFFVAVPGSMKRVSQPATSSRSSSPGGLTARTSPEKTVSEAMLLVLSGGEGYVDFRLGDGEETALEEQGGDLISVTTRGQSTNERSHIMVWQVSVT